jgi:hypothetical protein
MTSTMDTGLTARRVVKTLRHVCLQFFVTFLLALGRFKN